MTHTRVHKGVADDNRLGKFARQEHDWFERVRKGSLDPEEVMRAVQLIIDCQYSVYKVVTRGDYKASRIIEMSRYHYVSESITDDLYPIEEHDVSWRGIEVVKFDHAPSIREVFEAFDSRGLTPPTPEEALDFGWMNSCHVKDESVVFLCEPGQALNKDVHVLLLSDDGPKIPLSFNGSKQLSLLRSTFGATWTPNYVFAGARPIEPVVQ